MENICVLLTYPVPEYLVQKLEKRFTVFKFREVASNPRLLREISNSIRAIVGTSVCGADAGLIDALPKLEIVASYSVGFDKIDLVKCKERGIAVTNTPDVLTDDVADSAIGLALATLRRMCVCDRFVRSGKWKKGDFELTTKDRFSNCKES